MSSSNGYIEGPIFFSSVRKVDGGNYLVVDIHVLPDGCDHLGDGEIKFSFQANMQGYDEGEAAKAEKWYCGDVKVSARSLDRFNELAKLVRRLTSKDDMRVSLPILLSKVHKVCTEAIYDGRLHKYVALDQVLPAHYIRFMDKDRYPTYTAVAPDEETAKREMLQEAAGNGDTEWLSWFISTGQQVYPTNGYYSGNMDVRTLLQKIEDGKNF